MNTVRSMLKEKGHFVWSTSPDATVYDALKILADRDIGALLVVEAGKVIGVFSERDYARKVVLEGKSSLYTPVREIMASPIYCVRPETTNEECMALMTEKRIRHLPVMNEEGLVGLVSIGDVVKSLIADQQITIERLQDYAIGKYM